MVFTVQGLTGWEASAPLAEETKDPRRNVPLSVMLSIVIIGSFLVIVFWGVITGFGNDADAVVNSRDLPALGLAHRVWAWRVDHHPVRLPQQRGRGDALPAPTWAPACGTVMARSGSFPKALATVHPEHKTPPTPSWSRCSSTSWPASMSARCGIRRPASSWLPASLLVLAVTFAYIWANIGVFLFYWREKRDEFNWILHFVFPVVSAASPDLRDLQVVPR